MPSDMAGQCMKVGPLKVVILDAGERSDWRVQTNWLAGGQKAD